jgi:hypothetical protein
MNIYIDESGNTGGVSKDMIGQAFSGQPYFVLAALGVSDERKYESKFKLLIKKHRIKSSEIKSSNVYKKIPEFYSDFFALLKSEKVPLFIEAVDKKYMAVATIVDTIVLPAGSAGPDTQGSVFIRNSFADCLVSNLPDDILAYYLTISEGEYFLKEIYFFIESIIRIFENKPDDISKCLVHSLRMTEKEIQDEFESGQLNASRFLPSSDVNKSGKEIIVLPNLSSFANIYARLNKY